MLTVIQTPILASTALLTVLLLVGLFFFIRASAKQRIQVAKLVSDQLEEPLLEQLDQYFSRRAYRVTAVSAEQNLVTFEGVVRPSWFLAVFLTLLAAVGLLCLALLLSFAWPSATRLFPLLTLFAPIAGVFYWKQASRAEQVSLQIEPLAGERAPQNLLTVTAHRDELAELRRSLNLTPLPEASSR